MINRQNWLDIRSYLHYFEFVRQGDPETAKRYRSHLRHLLEWSDEESLTKARKLENPTYPLYLASLSGARSDGREGPLAPATIVHVLSAARQFFGYAREIWPTRYHHITQSWIELLVPRRRSRQEAHLEEHKFYTLKDVLQIVSTETVTLRQERAKMAVAMLYLSGMRADALASLPAACVNLDAREIHQLPDRGVRTKNNKAAITYLLEIPELMEVLVQWNERLKQLPPDGLWYSNLSTDGMQLRHVSVAVKGRNLMIEHDVRLACEIAGLPYLSPHKLRHGHVVYAMKLARNMAELKAISQNVMHTSVTITDQVYARLTNKDTKTIIGRLGTAKSPVTTEKIDQLISMLQSLKS